jgi:hypothetical protein
MFKNKFPSFDGRGSRGGKIKFPIAVKRKEFST